MLHALLKEKLKKRSYNSINNNKLRNKHLFADDGRILIVREDEENNKIHYFMSKYNIDESVYVIYCTYYYRLAEKKM